MIFLINRIFQVLTIVIQVCSCFNTFINLSKLTPILQHIRNQWESVISLNYVVISLRRRRSCQSVCYRMTKRMQSQSKFSILQIYFDWFCSLIIAAGPPIQKLWLLCLSGNRLAPTRHARRSNSLAIFLTITFLLLDARTIYCNNVSIFELSFRRFANGLASNVCLVGFHWQLICFPNVFLCFLSA